jgi:hypothetical protein
MILTSTATIETSLLAINSTLTPNTTLYVPSATASAAVTIHPSPVVVSATTTITWTRYSWTHTQHISVVTETPTCIVPQRSDDTKPDPTCTFLPTIKVPAALSTSASKMRRREVPEVVAKRALVARDLDAPTVTVTATPAVNSTTTIVAPTVTDTSTVVETTTQTM